MARQKATVTLDKRKANLARVLVHARSLSETLDVALDRLIRAEQLRHDVAAYLRTPDELGKIRRPVKLDLDDADVDYEALYGERKK